MPSTYKTKHGLNQWVETDITDMLDFNEDNEVIDSFMSHAVDNQPFQVEAAAWTESEYIAYPWETKIPVAGLGANDDALVLFDIRSVMAAREAGVPDGIGMTEDGGVRVYAVEKPEKAVQGYCSIIHRV